MISRLSVRLLLLFIVLIVFVDGNLQDIFARADGQCTIYWRCVGFGEDKILCSGKGYICTGTHETCSTSSQCGFSECWHVLCSCKRENCFCDATTKCTSGGGGNGPGDPKLE